MRDRRCSIVAVALATLVIAGTLTPARGQSGELTVSFDNGLTTVLARNTTIKDILQEWSRVGGTTILDADKLTDHRVTLELHSVPETRALRTLLRAATGYLAAPRAAGSTGQSRFDRILILATSRAVVPTAATPQRTATSADTNTLGVSTPNAAVAHTRFSSGAVQPQQVVSLTNLLRAPGSDPSLEPTQAPPPPAGNIPTSRPGLSMTSSSEQPPAVPTGVFGSTPPISQTDTPRGTPVAVPDNPE